MKWDFNLRLITPEELKSLPDGTKLKCIDGQEVTVGVDRIDSDTRNGLLAYGFPYPETK